MVDVAISPKVNNGDDNNNLAKPLLQSARESPVVEEELREPKSSENEAVGKLLECHGSSGQKQNILVGIIFGILVGLSVSLLIMNQNTQVQTNTNQIAVIHCMGSWSEFSDCSKTCDAGVKTRTFSINQTAIYGGKPCFASHGQEQKKTCNEGECPDCRGGWTNYSPCSKTCGRGNKKRHFIVEHDAQNGGKACVANHGDSQAQNCNTEMCPVDCTGQWAEWAPCSVTCGTGDRSRVFEISQNGEFDGNSCQHEHGYVDHENCAHDGCPINCFGEWAPYSECSVTCGEGVRSRTFEIRKHASATGKKCKEEAHTMQLGTCSQDPCGFTNECDQMVTIMQDPDPKLRKMDSQYVSVEMEEFAEDMDQFPSAFYAPIVDQKLCDYATDSKLMLINGTSSIQCVDSIEKGISISISLEDFLKEHSISLSSQSIEVNNGMVGDNGETYSCHAAIVGSGCMDPAIFKSQYLVDWTRKDLTRYDTVIAISDYTIGDQTHVWTDELSRLSNFYDIVRDDDEVKIHMRTSGISQKVMKFLDIDESSILSDRDRIRARKVIIPEGIPCGGINFVTQNQLAIEVRDRLETNYLHDDQGGKQESENKLMISVGHKNEHASIRNHKGLVTYFENNVKNLNEINNIEFLTITDEMTFEELAEKFYRTQVLITTTNNEIANMIFMKPGSIVIELFCSKNKFTLKNQQFAYYLGFRYYALHLKGPCHSGVKVKNKRLFKIVKKILGTN